MKPLAILILASSSALAADPAGITFFEQKVRPVLVDDLWPFRDYVVKSINDDKPFDQFITEHLAGDVIGKDNPGAEVGSAFLVTGPYDDVANQDIVAQKNIRAATLDDIITATGGAFLGLTINCAKCHHHKFDPIPTEDYYRLRSAFEGVTHGRRVIATKEKREAFAAATKPLADELKQLEAERAALDQAIEARAKIAVARNQPTRPKIDLHGTSETFAPVTARHLKFVIHSFTGDFQGAAVALPRASRAADDFLRRFNDGRDWFGKKPFGMFIRKRHTEEIRVKAGVDFPGDGTDRRLFHKGHHGMIFKKRVRSAPGFLIKKLLKTATLQAPVHRRFWWSQRIDRDMPTRSNLHQPSAMRPKHSGK